MHFMLLFFACFLLVWGLITFRTTQKNWRLYTKQVQMKCKENHPDSKSDSNEKPNRESTLMLWKVEDRFQRCIYRLRMGMGTIMLLISASGVGFEYFWFQEMKREIAYCILVLLLLLFLEILLAGIVGVLSYVHISRKDASEIIQEEREFLQRELKRQNPSLNPSEFKK